MTAHPTPQTSVVRIPAGAHWLECELSAAGSAAIMVAAARPHEISAVVSCGGRGDLAGSALKRVMAPTLLMVGGLDTIVIRLNREALARMSAEVVMEIVPGATRKPTHSIAFSMPQFTVSAVFSGGHTPRARKRRHFVPLPESGAACAYALVSFSS